MRERRLKPVGHSAFIESLITPMIIIGSTTLSAVATYVLSQENMLHILNGSGNAVDIFLIVLSAGLGFMVDSALIVAATRYKMHALRGVNDRRWKHLSQSVLALCLGVETLTLAYFFFLMAPNSVPSWMIYVLTDVHSMLFFVRAFLPPIIITYFIAGVLPVTIDRADRDRDLLSRTSQDISTLVGRLTTVNDTTDPNQMIRLLASQLELNAYADQSSDEDHERDRQLIERLMSLHGIVPDIMNNATVKAQDDQQTPSPPSDDIPDLSLQPAAFQSEIPDHDPEPSSRRGHGNRRQSSARARRLNIVRQMLEANPRASASEVANRLRVSRSTAHSMISEVRSHTLQQSA